MCGSFFQPLDSILRTPSTSGACCGAAPLRPGCGATTGAPSRVILFSLSSRVILSLVPPVTAALAAYNSTVELGRLRLLPDGSSLPLLHAWPLPYQLTPLVFRAEASYSRFEEGRKAWSRVIVGAADLAREAMAVAADGDDNLCCNFDLAIEKPFNDHFGWGSGVWRRVVPLAQQNPEAEIPTPTEEWPPLGCLRLDELPPSPLLLLLSTSSPGEVSLLLLGNHLTLLTECAFALFIGSRCLRRWEAIWTLISWEDQQFYRFFLVSFALWVAFIFISYLFT